jgi:integrase
MKTPSTEDVKFLLKDARATALTLVYLVFRFDNSRFKYSTGQTVEPFQWNATDQRAYTNQKNKAVRSEHETINGHLDRHRAALVRVVTRLQMAGAVIDNATIKEHLDRELNKAAPKRATVEVEQVAAESFTAYIARFVAEGQTGRRLNKKGTHYAAFTLTGYLKLRRILNDFKTETGRGIDYADITLDFYKAFKLWLTGRGLSLNYVGSLLKDLKVLLKQAQDDGLHENTAYMHRDFKKMTENVDSIYLNDAELNALFILDLTKNPRLDRTRDLFLIGAYTGLRFSDFSELRPENIINGGRVLSCRTHKTGERVDIPIHPNVSAILAKYEGIPPRAVTNQQMNVALKDLGKLAAETIKTLAARVESTRTQGGGRNTRRIAKWELLTTHTARRSFATNAYLARIPLTAIMKMTGHRSEVMLSRYLKVSSEQNALLYLDHPHFAGTAA